MKRLLLFLTACLLTTFTAFSQTIELSDDFESGTANWVLEGSWGLTTAQSSSPSNSLTDSPGGNYATGVNVSATTAVGIDLSAALDANLTFNAIYDIEGGNFDYCYVEASGDGGTTWVNIATFLGEGNLTPWVEYNYSLGGLVGNSDVRVRFRLFSDGGYEVDGIYIDDVVITSSDVDNSAPLVLHTPPAFYEGSASDMVLFAELIDVSGIGTADLHYTVDGGATETVAGINVVGNFYGFIIPAQAAGSQVDYFLDITDAAPGANNATSATYSYIAGQHVYVDDASVDFVNSFGPDAAGGLLGAAVKLTLNGTADIAYALIRNYTDTNRPNSDFEFHIWADDAGLPGADLVTPFMVTPEATLANNSPMTRVDLRPYMTELADMTGDVFVGFTVPAGQTWIVQTTPAIANRTYSLTGTTWALETDDYHFRIVTTQFDTPDACADAADLTSLLGQGNGNAQTSPMIDNTDATVDGTEPADGFDCFLEDTPTLNNPVWYTFVGDGGDYEITTTNCGGFAANYLEDGDSQIAVYEGTDCGNLTAVACNDDGNVEPDALASIVVLQTTPGTTYYVLVDGWDGSVGEFCVQITEVDLVTCEDISVGTSTGEENVCFGATTVFTIDGVVVPNIDGLNQFRWAVFAADVTGSTSPFTEASYQGAFGGSPTAYAPALVNDGTQLPAGSYYFTPIVFGGAIDTDGTVVGLDFSEGCVITGSSILVNLLPAFDAIEGSGASVNEVTPPGNNGEASVAVAGGSGAYTYEWSNGETTESITGLASGDYMVTVSDATGCGDDFVITVTVGLTVGTEDLAFQQAINLFPNPANQQAQISFNFQESVDLQVKLTNTIGAVMQQQVVSQALNGTLQLDLNNLAEGVYFVHLSDGKHQATQRLVVSR
ncbi:MAG: hypothetical protein DHS20C18_03840 [Saprospiraceae bacterium]|nr:MAG: hypothetical protein DHS20C18_03840 [Saprospiraceae bacterium]